MTRCTAASPGPCRAEDGILHAGDLHMRAFTARDPEDLPWDDLEVDVVIESTGRFRTHSDAARHMTAGAAR